MKCKILFIALLILSFTLLIGCSNSSSKTEQLKTEITDVRVRFYVDEEVYYSKKYEIGSTIKLPDEPYKEGYRFIGWYTKDGKEIASKFLVEKKLDLYARFEEENVTEKKQYTVKFYVNGELYYEEVYEQDERISEVITPDSPTGYEFVGWYTEDKVAFKANYIITSDLNVYAKFGPIGEPPLKYYTVTYYVDGFVYLEEKYEEGLKIPYIEPSKYGYQFLYWVDDYGYSYYGGEYINSDLNLYAVFDYIEPTIGNYTITYYVDGNWYASDSMAPGNTIYIINAPEKEGYEFKGWFDDYGIEHFNGEIIYSSFNLYAKYEEITEEFYIVNIYRYSNIYESVTVLGGSYLDISSYFEMVMPGETFIGFKDQYGNEYTSNSILVTKNLELECMTEIWHYYITYVFEYEDVNNPNPEYVAGYHFIDLLDATLEGYEFKGWYLDSDYITPYVHNYEYNRDDFTVYGKFESIEKEIFTYIEYPDYILVTGYVGDSDYLEISGQYKGKRIEIAEYAFKDSNLKEISFWSVLDNVNDNCLAGCDTLEKLQIAYYSYGTPQYFKDYFDGNIPSSLNNLTLFMTEYKPDFFLGSEDNQIKTLSINFSQYIDTPILEQLDNLENLIIGYGVLDITPAVVSTLKDINIFLTNNNLANKFIDSTCNVYLYSEFEPTLSGNYWHYVDGEPVIWDEVDSKVYTVTFIYIGEIFKTIEVKEGEYVYLDTPPINTDIYSVLALVDQNQNFYIPYEYIQVFSDLTLTIQLHRHDVLYFEYIFEYEGVYNPNQSIIENYQYNGLLAPSLSGYEFVGWYLDSNYTQEFDQTDSTPRDIILYGKFIEIDNHIHDYEVVFEWIFDYGYNIDSLRLYAYLKCQSDSAHIDDTYAFAEGYTVEDFLHPSCSNDGYITVNGFATYDGVAYYDLETLTLPKYEHDYDEYGQCMICGYKELHFSYNEYDSYIEITGYTGNDTDTVIIPGYINGKNVYIGDTSMMSLPLSVKEVIISEGVLSIGESAFDKCSIEKISLPNSLLNIENYAFYMCYNLTISYLPSNISYIGTEAFRGCHLDGIVIKNMGYSFNSFSECSGYVYFEGNHDAWYNAMLGLSYEQAYFYYETREIYFQNTWRYVDGIPTVWEDIYYTITLMVDNEIYEEKQVLHGDYINCPMELEKSGHTFLGWYDINDIFYYGGDYALKDLVLYAKFAEE